MAYTRVSTIAKDCGIPSKYFVEVLNLVEPNVKHSASTRVDMLNRGNFWQSVTKFAVIRWRASKSRFVIV